MTLFAVTANQLPRAGPSNHLPAYKRHRGTANSHLSFDAHPYHIHAKTHIIGPIKLTDLGGHKCRWNDGTRPRPPKHRTARLGPRRATTEFGPCEPTVGQIRAGQSGRLIADRRLPVYRRQAVGQPDTICIARAGNARRLVTRSASVGEKNNKSVICVPGVKHRHPLTTGNRSYIG